MKYCISGTFDGDFYWAVWWFFLNHHTKVTTNTIFKEDTEGVSLAMPGPWAQVNICQSVFAAKSPNLMSAKCTTVTYVKRSLCQNICSLKLTPYMV